MNILEYKDVIVKSVFELNDEEQVIFKTPFSRYSEEVWCEGSNVTYSYRNDLSLVGKECLVFTSVIDQHPVLPSEIEKAFADKNTISSDWEKAKADPFVLKHYPVTKKVALSVTDKEGKVTPYIGADEAELVKPYGLFNVKQVKPIEDEPTQ